MQTKPAVSTAFACKWYIYKRTLFTRLTLIQHGHHTGLAYIKNARFISLNKISHSGNDFEMTNRKCYSKEPKLLSSIEHARSAYMVTYLQNTQTHTLLLGGLVGGWTKVWRYNFDWWSAIAAESIESLPTSAVKGAACFPSALNNWRQSVTSLGQGVLTHACSVLLHNHVTPIYTSTRNVKTGLDPLRSAARLFGSLFSSWDHNS